jgi:hypothetical protein
LIDRESFNPALYSKTRKPHPFLYGCGVILCLFPIAGRENYLCEGG